MSQPAKRSSLIIIVPILIIVAGLAYYWASHRKPDMDLDIAIEDKQEAVIKQWIRSGIKYDEFSCTNGQYQPVFFAASEENPQALKDFLSDGAKADSFEKKHGYSALMAACKVLNTDEIKTLLDKKADANVISKDGRTALVEAIAAGRETFHETAKWKLSDAEKAAFHEKPQKAADAVRMLLAAGADPSKGKLAGSGPVFQAFYSPEIVQLLVDKGVKLTSVDDSGKNLLFVAQDKDLANKLLAAGVDPKKKMNDGRTALMWGESPDVAEILLAHGVDVNAVDEKGDSAMHYMAMTPNDTMPKIKVLLAHGAKWDEPDKAGFTPFALASIATRKDLADMLKAKGAKPIPPVVRKHKGAGGGGGL